MEFDTIKQLLEGVSHDPNERLDYIFNEYGYTIKDFADTFGIPYRTVQNWRGKVSKPPLYVINLIFAYILSRKRCERVHGDIADMYNKLDKAKDLLHDGRIREGIDLIDNI